MLPTAGLTLQITRVSGSTPSKARDKGFAATAAVNCLDPPGPNVAVWGDTVIETSHSADHSRPTGPAVRAITTPRSFQDAIGKSRVLGMLNHNRQRMRRPLRRRSIHPSEGTRTL